MTSPWSITRITIDGAEVSWVDVGSGEPVLLLHGYPQSHLCWRNQIGPLSLTHRVIAPDWFGWGESDRKLDLVPAYPLEVERIGKLVQALGLTDFNLIGHDYGGHIGLGYVIRYPQNVRRFAILNSRAHQTFAPAFYRQTAVQCFMARRLVLRSMLQRLPLAQLHRRELEKYVGKGCFDEELLNRYIGWMDTEVGRRWFAHFFAHYGLPPRSDLITGLSTIRCPVSVVWGDKDPYCPLEIGRDLTARIAGAQFTVLAGADHFVIEERPREVLDAIITLLARSTFSTRAAS